MRIHRTLPILLVIATGILPVAAAALTLPQVLRTSTNVSSTIATRAALRAQRLARRKQPTLTRVSAHLSTQPTTQTPSRNIACRRALRIAIRSGNTNTNEQWDSTNCGGSTHVVKNDVPNVRVEATMDGGGSNANVHVESHTSGTGNGTQNSNVHVESHVEDHQSTTTTNGSVNIQSNSHVEIHQSTTNTSTTEIHQK